MAKFSVDLSHVPPKGGVPVSTQHPALPDMPPSRGAAFASVPPPTQNVRRTPKMLASVRGLPPDTPDLTVAPVPPSSVFSEPPQHVTAAPPADPSHPAWLA